MLPRGLADETSQRSLATRLRRQRFQLLLTLLSDFTPPVTILDVGGRQRYWEMMAGNSGLLDRMRVTLLNIAPQPVTHPSFTTVVGDGRAMPQYADHAFDIVFSNSTIEHVGAYEDQRRMAAEVRRLGRAYYVQTPNRHFPIEPHFMFPFFQYLPIPARSWMLQHFTLGWTLRQPDPRKAREEVAGIRLLTRGEVRALFPGARLHEERVLGLAKSFVAYRPVAT